MKENETMRKKQILTFRLEKRKKKRFHYWNLCTIYRSHSFISRNNVEFYERFCFSCSQRATRRRSHELCGGGRRDNRTAKALWKEKQILSHFLTNKRKIIDEITRGGENTFLLEFMSDTGGRRKKKATRGKDKKKSGEIFDE